ncbi:hypothetical protein [Limosilactobacillus sp.]|uniref:hypothetical protein n=1 Tax=Limosilactobacillus sp. TaxID=2773925 RepID=UPI003F01D5E3
MFNIVFWILAIWFVINVVWMWFRLDDQSLQKTFAWINVCAIVIGFLVLYLSDHASGGVTGWFTAINWINIVVAILQFYYGYRSNSVGSNVHHAGSH